MSLKFTRTEKTSVPTVKIQSHSEGEGASAHDDSPRSIQGSFQFTYSKNETYHLLLSYSSMKVRTLHIDNIMGYKLTKTPL